MNILEIIDKKIQELETSPQTVNTEAIEELKSSIERLEECGKALTEEDLLLNYDFTVIYDLLDVSDEEKAYFSKYIQEIKEVIMVRKELMISSIPFSEEQMSCFNTLRDTLINTVKSLLDRIKDYEEHKDDKERIESLKDLRNLMAGVGRRKYYTYDMFNAFYDIIDWESIPYEDAKALLAEFYKRSNMKNNNDVKESMDNVIALYKEFLRPEEFVLSGENEVPNNFVGLLLKYEPEVTSSIDLENAREILQFFKNEGILENFESPALLMITIYGNANYVINLYKKIMAQYPDQMDLYYVSQSATLWTCEKSVQKRSPFRFTKGVANKENDDSLYSQCHSVTESEFRENIKLLDDNKECFSEKYDVLNFGAHLKAKTISSGEADTFKSILRLVTTKSWMFRKNMSLCKIFGIGEFSKIPVSCLENVDIETRVHLAIELGLLNPPMNEYYRELEKELPRYEQFSALQSKKGLYNQSMRNYFSRYASRLSGLTINDFIFLAYKVVREGGRMGMYLDFFSDSKAGQMGQIFDDPSRKNMATEEGIEEVISSNFADIHEGNYDYYDELISEYDFEQKKSRNGNDYYDESILEDELIQEFERKYGVRDLLTHDGEMIEISNQFVYQVGSALISRYKVLHNASILKNAIGRLDPEMLLTCVVRNSFISKEEYEVIKEAIMGRTMTK